MADHLLGVFSDVYAAILPTLAFESGVQVNYESAVRRIKDGLPKLNDFPAEMGDSSEITQE